MEEKYFKSYIDLGNYMYELAKEKSKDVVAVATYEEAAEIIKWLVAHEDVQIKTLDLHSYEWEFYDKEFYLSITPDLEVYVEPVYLKSKTDSNEFDRLISAEADVIFYSGDANYKIAKQCSSDESYEFVIGEGSDDEDETNCGECSYDCSNCPIGNKDNSKFRVHTVTISREGIPSALRDFLF